MTETKRVTFTTISSTVNSALTTTGSSGSSRFGADFLSHAEKSTNASTAASSGTKGLSKTIRLNVELFQTDSNKYPEFNYAKLLHLEKKKLKKLKQKSNGFSDPFEENDNDVARIAKELEKKYGNAYSTGRGKNKRDDIDIGMGYDETDSFIDNTEAYDELIPAEVETIEGGFYINCGALEFKKLHTESYTTKTDEIIKMPNRPKKRAISSSSEESSTSDDEDENDDNDSEDNGDVQSGEASSVETTKSKSSANKNKKIKPSSVKASNPVKKKALAAENGGLSKKKKEKNIVSCSASNSPKIVGEERASDIERNLKKVEKTTTVKDMLKAQRDNFLKSQNTSSNGEGNGKSSAEDDEDDDSSSDDSEDDDDDESDDNSDSTQSATQESKNKKQTSGPEDQGSEKLRISDTNLPQLEQDILSSITEFRDGVKSKNLIGKKFQFDDKLAENFLKIDDSLLCLDKGHRTMVFAHLEFQLSLPKYYFLRKAKQLRIKEEKLKSKRTFNKLHKAITETMPAVLASYEAELRRYTELLANPTTEQSAKMPKKKFPWNTNLRTLLYDVYQVRWTSYPVLGTRKETLEEFITSFMREKVVNFWPKGWMRFEELQKEIEKRKTAAKKAKEKKKAASATTSGQSSPHPNVVNNPLMTLQIASVSSLAGATSNTGLRNAAATTPTTSVTYIKQFEEFNNRSNANSDTDSVASSSTSSGIKRKNTNTTRNKPSKLKAPKLPVDQTKSIIVNSNNNRNTPTTTILTDLASSSKRTDHSINYIMSPTEGNVMVPSMASSIFSATTAAVSQPLKHSTSTHVIDLDNYKSVGDILQTSKEIQAAANAAASSIATITKSTVSRRESSGDSEIEIVGVFPAKQPNKKMKNNRGGITPNSNYSNTEKTSPSSSHHHAYHNNNNSSNSNRKKAGNSGSSNLPGMDVNKMVHTLMELGDGLQIKPILTSTDQQQTKTSTNQMAQGTGSLQ